MSWQSQMHQELGEMGAVDRFVASGAWITEMTQTLLPELRRERRLAVLELLAQDDWDPQRVAETVGSRRTTIQRLAEEGRAMLRDEARDEAREALVDAEG